MKYLIFVIVPPPIFCTMVPKVESPQPLGDIMGAKVSTVWFDKVISFYLGRQLEETSEWWCCYGQWGGRHKYLTRNVLILRLILRRSVILSSGVHRLHDENVGFCDKL